MINYQGREHPVLFIIGNGFDLSLHMKTKYQDMYETYLQTESQSEVIAAFKSDLSKQEQYEKWSDFEMGIAEYAKQLDSETDLIECIRDFKKHMVEHLKKEYAAILQLFSDPDYAIDLVQEFMRSITNFYDCFSPNTIRTIDSVAHDLVYEMPNIITFNYTLTLEAFLSPSKNREKMVVQPLHIHGSLEQDVVLGIDNISQLKELPYSVSNRGSRTFIKPVFNHQYDTERILEAQRMIKTSKVICIYGFSMGESDKMWVDAILDWLREDSNHHLILYQYDKTTYPLYNFDAIMDEEEKKKMEFLKKWELQEEIIQNQIHIPIGYDIFNFNFTKTIITGAAIATPPVATN